MIVDTSAVVAVARREPGHEAVLDALRSERGARMSVASFVELTIVVRHEASVSEVQALLEDLGITVAPVDVAQGRLAASAYRRYGRGSTHPAKLNYGDVFAYALAAATGEDLLYIGDDFARTDLPGRL